MGLLEKDREEQVLEKRLLDSDCNQYHNHNHSLSLLSNIQYPLY